MLRGRTAALSCLFPSLLIPALALGTAAPAIAQQVSGSIAVESDFRLRGYSMSAGRPVATARGALDSGSGVYADGSASIVLARDGDVRFLAYQVDAGMAKRLGGLWTVDVGLAHNHFRAAYSGALSYSYTEAYAGATRGPVSAYVFVSPNYFRDDVWTLYGQVEANIAPAKDWRLTAHVGSLHYLAAPESYGIHHYARYDWRLGVTREFGPVEMHAALSGGGPGREFFYGKDHSRTALTAGASVSF